VKRWLNILLWPNGWVSVACVLAGLGLIAGAIGFLLRDKRFADAAFWLMLPLWILGLVMLVAIVPVLIIIKRSEWRRRDRKDEEG